MNDSPLAVIRSLFVERYDNLKARVAKRLGSFDLAGDAMHDAWLRLAGADAVSSVHNPDSYLYRVVLNVAEDRRRRERRHRHAVEIDAAMDVPDETASPEEVLLAQSDLEVFRTIIAELPERRRTIFLAARFGNIPRQEIADRLGISRRSVAREIMLAHMHCMARRNEFRE
ncbi:RNA polymerase sigma-70 factor (ECF subfamily) [Rhodopseudomonas rhenobacensis]|uniref:RNA polymerase sigma-70 factor (ECF subfamily) n=1 Tax=Rhodopseudomonas rhenobacensis TaxID=87461 RepID=A0A7W7Z170_9BRAD|nr:sigma-70 family RNA polymerase sigma factor [Rhodopseudomonas rhenobacensis]MBB5045900.1 RNA polymerase sigma-70 factor (ECF subfamily) [Rhodopseudomonas rhenobacensis]